ncbi:hypothetical protein CCP3SC1_1680006 [Gammaproteobacteria bacterium]
MTAFLSSPPVKTFLSAAAFPAEVEAESCAMQPGAEKGRRRDAPGLVKATCDDISVSFTEDGWFNATEVAARFGKEPFEWLRLPSTREYLAALDRKYGKIPYSKTRRGGDTRTIPGKSRNGGTWLHPKLGVLFARWLDIDFAIWCDEQIDGLLRGTHPHYDWKRIRHEATSSFKVMCDILRETHKCASKETASHHYSNEARLIGWLITGEFREVDRETLSSLDLTLLAKLEERNAILIGRGVEYSQRKETLSLFVIEWRKNSGVEHVPSIKGGVITMTAPLPSPL